MIFFLKKKKDLEMKFLHNWPHMNNFLIKIFIYVNHFLKCFKNAIVGAYHGIWLNCILF